MFTDKALDAVSFGSQLTTNKSEQSANVQTTNIVYKEDEVQSVERKSVETQTPAEQRKILPVDVDKLADFLKRVTPSIIEALDEAHGTNAFDDYDPKIEDESLTNTQLLLKMNTAGDIDSETPVSDVSWSAGGGTLAVSHGVVHHENWCNHLSKIQLYDRTTEGAFVDVPSRVLETNACVQALSYHPTEPAILAAGLFNGDVLVWKLSNTSSITPIFVDTHDDCVKQLLWKPTTFNNGYELVSASVDGYILLHAMQKDSITISNKRFKIMKEHNPVEKLRPRSAGGTRERALESGLHITSLDFSRKDSAICIVGTLCGGLYKCRLDRVAPVEGNETYNDPVIDKYEKHEGSITSVKCSPIRNLFFTAGADKEIRIYDFDQSPCLNSISVDDTVVGLTLISNQDMFAAYGAGPNIELYKIQDAKVVTHERFGVDDRENTSTLRVNLKRGLLAMGDTKGSVEIWQLARQ